MKWALIVALLTLTACSGGGQERVVVAAGTTLVDSGLLDAVAGIFEESHPEIELSVVGEASARVLELGRRGGADVLITHAPTLEQGFIRDGIAARYELVLSSTYVIVGPPDGVTADTSAEVLAAIADTGGPFVSRADGSGTHEIERQLWAAAGIDPSDESWYLETGQGMGLTLQVTDQRHGFTLSELGTFLAASDTLSLEPIEVGDAPPNPYHLIVVGTSPERAAGEKFLEWLIGPEGRRAVEQVNRDLFDRIVFRPPA